MYKSLNLNQSVSNSSRGDSNSREFQNNSRENSGEKYGIGITRVLGQNSSKTKFQVSNSQMLSERKTRIRNNKRDLSRENSEGYIIAKKGLGVSKEKNSITQQFYSPHEQRKLIRNKSKAEQSLQKRKLVGVKTQRSKISDNFKKESYKVGTRGLATHSKTKQRQEINYRINNTFESQKGLLLKTGRKEIENSMRKPENYKTKDLYHLKQEFSQENIGNTLDSARSSDNSNNRIKNPVKEFMDAAAGGVRDKLDKYIKTGKIPHINCTDHNMKTALHYAAGEGRFKTVGFLLNHKIDPNLQTKSKKETALHIACKKGFKRIIISLLDNNSNPNIQDSGGKTPLHVVAEQNIKDQIIAFINHCKFPIDWDLVDNQRRKAFEVSNSQEIKRLLTTYMKTASAQRYSRETRLYNKLNSRGSENTSNSRSKSKESGSLSKRTYKFGKQKTPVNSKKSTVKGATSNILVHQTRNESVKRMFKNFNRTKEKVQSIRKKINLSGTSKINI